MNEFSLPLCPKCSGVSTNPIRQGMTATPYKCTECGHSFNLDIQLNFDESNLRKHSVVIGSTVDGMSILQSARESRKINSGRLGPELLPKPQTSNLLSELIRRL